MVLQPSQSPGHRMLLPHTQSTPRAPTRLWGNVRAGRAWTQRGAGSAHTTPPPQNMLNLPLFTQKSAILYSADLGVPHKGDLTLPKQWAETKSRLTSEDPASRFNTRASKKKATFPEPTVKSNPHCQIKFLHTWHDLIFVQFLFQ